MDVRQLTPGLSVAPQIFATDVPKLKESGFRAIICNRPDGEGTDQPVFAEIEQAAKALGMEARYLPAESGKVSDEQGKAFGALLAELPKPVFAYCRTGMRSTTMWALSQSGSMPLPSILEKAGKAGFDLAGVVRRIANHGKTPLEVEQNLERVIPPEFMLHAHHWLILHGRYTCLARKPRCEVCLINDLCRWPEKTV